MDAHKDSTAERKADLLVELERHLGVMAPAAKAADVPRSTAYLWMKQDPEFKAAVEEVIEVAIDYAEGVLFRLIRAGNVQAVIFFLKTRGKRRGYTEAVEAVTYAPDTPPAWFDGSPIEG
jgi:hypothetical protein